MTSRVTPAELELGKDGGEGKDGAEDLVDEFAGEVLELVAAQVAIAADPRISALIGENEGPGCLQERRSPPAPDLDSP